MTFIENLWEGLIYTLPPYSNYIIVFFVTLTPHTKYWATKLLPKKHETWKDTQVILTMVMLMGKVLVLGEFKGVSSRHVRESFQEEAMSQLNEEWRVRWRRRQGSILILEEPQVAQSQDTHILQYPVYYKPLRVDTGRWDTLIMMERKAQVKLMKIRINPKLIHLLSPTELGKSRR